MANSLFALGKERTLNQLVNWKTDVIKVALVSADYLPNLDTDAFFDAIAAYTLGQPQTLANKTTTRGVFDADDVAWLKVAAGATAKAVVLFKDTGEPGTSPLLAYIDTITGFPVATNGSDVSVQWNGDAFKIFSL